MVFRMRGLRQCQIYSMDVRDLMALARERVTAHPSENGCLQYFHVDKCPQIPFW